MQSRLLLQSIEQVLATPPDYWCRTGRLCRVRRQNWSCVLSIDVLKIQPLVQRIDVEKAMCVYCLRQCLLQVSLLKLLCGERLTTHVHFSSWKRCDSSIKSTGKPGNYQLRRTGSNVHTWRCEECFGRADLFFSLEEYSSIVQEAKHRTSYL